MNTTKQYNTNHLRHAFGMPDDYSLSEADIREIRYRLKSIFPYAIMFTARSGSTFLTHELQQTTTLSKPEEWFNWSNIAGIEGIKKISLKDYILGTVLSNASVNGVFGMELTWHQFHNLNDIAPLQRLFSHKIKWFFLRRRNLISQGISHYIAADSGIYHSYQVNSDSLSSNKNVKYDPEALKRHISELLNQEVSASSWMKSNNIHPVNIYYEDVVADPLETALAFSNVIGSLLPDEYLKGKKHNPIKKIATSLNDEFEEIFRSEEADFIESIISSRPRVLFKYNNV